MTEPCILILEDNADRITQFTGVLARLASDMPVLWYRSAKAMVREIGEYLGRVAFMSLDHDLEPYPGEEDLGEGVDVTRHLATLRPACPVIIHTSNSDRASWMMADLERAGWKCVRVPPIGDDWVESDWCRAVGRCLKRFQRRRA
jgi:hypothetical protein